MTLWMKIHVMGFINRSSNPEMFAPKMAEISCFGHFSLYLRKALTIIRMKGILTLSSRGPSSRGFNFESGVLYVCLYLQRVDRETGQNSCPANG